MMKYIRVLLMLLDHRKNQEFRSYNYTVCSLELNLLGFISWLGVENCFYYDLRNHFTFQNKYFFVRRKSPLMTQVKHSFVSLLKQFGFPLKMQDCSLIKCGFISLLKCGIVPS